MEHGNFWQRPALVFAVGVAASSYRIPSGSEALLKNVGENFPSKPRITFEETNFRNPCLTSINGEAF